VHINLCEIDPVKKIEITHDISKPIDEFELPIKIRLSRNFHTYLSLPDAIELSDKLSFAIQDYKRTVLGE